MAEDVVSFDEVEQREIKWIWPGWIPRGMLTLVEGDPGVGKSFYLCSLTAMFSRGCTPDGSIETANGEIIRTLIYSEDPPREVIRPRLDSLNAVNSRIYCPRGALLDEVDGKPSVNLWQVGLQVRNFKKRVDLVIIDPLINFAGGLDTNQASKVAAMLEPLCRLAYKMQFGLVCNLHLNKSITKALYKGQGSMQFQALAKSVILIVKGENNERGVCHIKANFTREQRSMGFTLEDSPRGPAKFTWSKDRGRWSPDELLRDVMPDFGDGAAFAKGFLTGYHSTQTDAIQAARAAGISDSARLRAEKDLGYVKETRYRKGEE